MKKAQNTKARVPTTLALVALAVAPAACGHDWDSFDPRLGSGGSAGSSTGGSAGTGGSTPTTGGSAGTMTAGGTGGTMTAGGTGGTMTAGGTGGTMTAGGTGGTMSSGGTGGTGGITMICMPGTSMYCYDGPTKSAGVGLCKAGDSTCAVDGLSYGPCLNEVLPVAESCAPVAGMAADEDCDGVTDDHCGMWAKQFGKADDQEPLAMAIDAMGNLAVAGFMAGTVNLGNGDVTSAGGRDAFVFKLSNDGAPQWSKVIGDPMEQEAHGVAVDPAGNVIVTGFFQGTVSFNGAAGPFHTSQGLDDVFVVKYDPNGNYLWSETFPGAGTDHGNGVTTDSNGNIFVTGSFDVDIHFGVGPIYSSADVLDGFLVKLDPMGVPIWSKTFGGTGNDEGLALTTDAGGHVFLAGNFDETVDFGGGVIVDAGGDDVFVAELTGAGGYVFASAYGGSNNQTPTTIALDAAGNIIVAGEDYGLVDFGGPNGPVLNLGKIDTFITKLDPAGNYLWMTTFGSAENENHPRAVVDKNGDIVYSVSLEGAVDFGSGLMTNAGIAGASDVVIGKLSGADGKPLWARKFGDPGDQDARGLVIDPMNAIIVTGEFSGIMDFGPGAALHLDNVSVDDIFLAKIANN